MSYRGRFAPSPTGALHLGSLVAAVGSWLRARQRQGEWIIRIEDIDRAREVPGAAADMLATLAAFGLHSDAPVIYQSARMPAYAQAFEQLRAAGMVFPCWCSRSDLEASGGLHHGACVASPIPSREPAWRLRVPEITIEFEDAALGRQSENLAEAAGDFVIKRVDGAYAYQLAVVVDDAFQGISEVVRGADLLSSTARQIHLQRLLGLATPAYLHLPLVVDASGRKLSKQDHARRVDPAGPMRALRMALEFLGLDDVAYRRPASCKALLASAAERFEVSRLRAMHDRHGQLTGAAPDV
jgi:glutamyl-Q tRNA(Asp) synthetase